MKCVYADYFIIPFVKLEHVISKLNSIYSHLMMPQNQKTYQPFEILQYLFISVRFEKKNQPFSY